MKSIEISKRYLWLFLPLLGLFTLGGLLISQQSFTFQRSSTSKAAPVNPSSPTPPAPTPTTAAPDVPIASKFSAPPTASKAPSAKASPSPSPSTAPAQPIEGKPALTPEQEAMNQAYKESMGIRTSIDSLIEMRIAITKGVSAVSLGTTSGATVLAQDGKTLANLESGATYTAQAGGDSISLDGTPLPAIVWVEPPADGLFTLGNRTYRGRLLLVAEAGNLWAVNFVNMREYLYSVVASEVSPSWHPEALKAQAVAARSYALTYYFKPVNSLYQMGDDEYFQVYSGIDREAPETNRAVDATAGEFVSYRGGIVESLYAASDDIVAEAFQGHGMSQLGALGLANQGYQYQQILGNYYPGTNVGRIAHDTQ